MKKSILILGVVSVLFLSLNVSNLEVFSKKDPLSFESLNSDIIMLANYQKGDLPLITEIRSGKISKKATFDKNSAQKAGFNRESLETFYQINEYNNELISDIKQNFSNQSLINKYPLAKKYFKEAKDRYNRGIFTTFDYSKSTVSKGNMFEINTFADSSQNQCGTWGNPKPTSSAPWVTWYLSTSKLSDWGYHPTAWYVGTNDFTRSKSWNTGWCRTNSFREHAIIKDINKFVEQKYDGYSPNGEPNPEVDSYSWPYWNWPSYARWWHANY
jgi:hypothetical protein